MLLEEHGGHGHELAAIEAAGPGTGVAQLPSELGWTWAYRWTNNDALAALAWWYEGAGAALAVVPHPRVLRLGGEAARPVLASMRGWHSW